MVDAYIQRRDADAPLTAMILVTGSSLLATAAEDSDVIWLYSLETLRPVTSLTAHPAPITALFIVPGPPRLLSGDADAGLLVWDLSTFQLLSQTDHQPSHTPPRHELPPPPPRSRITLRHKTRPGAVSAVTADDVGHYALVARSSSLFVVVLETSAVASSVTNAHADVIAAVHLLAPSRALSVDVSGATRLWSFPDLVPLATLDVLASDLVALTVASSCAVAITDGDSTLVWHNDAQYSNALCTAASLHLSLLHAQPPAHAFEPSPPDTTGAMCSPFIVNESMGDDAESMPPRSPAMYTSSASPGPPDLPASHDKTAD
ncbi:uncharacterized protein AMSG_03533 [Thecamonas trahens ATCC 50062]|uniref:Uncharacterized protein n=1 Tax=Thecamonas trahens ATCC 50062 TaxID=461836 RepID=A0A0L0D471_THETB|nr:hypothetical protein AMSG_03533 [Thecamonas trahens ATCC 50062]KNC47104.1 hypothetical protein AMSG_03533 [Thecamonas trahens ATCC 50062]|eukprot:XP_013759881.1 hypothetical protein AMSG_03533 [Thecamonas trahens ATCC 50062]